MSWLSELIKKVVRQEAIDFVLSDALQVSGQPLTAPIVEDAQYLSVVVKQLRLPYTRVGVERLYGIVHAFGSVQRLGAGEVNFACTTMPARLAGVDPKSIGNVLTISKTVMGPAPWRGGALTLEIGLFSVVAENLAGPFLDTMSALSDKVGVGFAAAAAPYVDVLRAGASALTRASGSVRLEVGLDIEIKLPQAQVFAVVAAKKGELDKTALSVDVADFKLKVNGRDYTEKPYMVLAIEASDRRDDWAEIPELRSAYEAVDSALKQGKDDEAKEAFVVFKRVVRLSPDLVVKDQKRLIQLVEARVNPDGAAGGAVGAKGVHPYVSLPFEMLPLYEAVD